jgi:HK97 family phage major capsid protein
MPATLLGYPVAEFEDMPSIDADTLSIAFANFSEAYQIVDRAGVRVLRDPYTAKPYVLFYTTKRVGGDVVNFEAVKLIRFASAA